MNIREQASNFTVFVLSQDADLGSRVKLSLGKALYDTYFFADFDEMFGRLELNPPHIVVVDYESLVMPLADFFEKILKISSEIKVICLSNTEHYSTFLEFNNYNLVNFFDRQAHAVELQIVASVDQICEGLYRLYQNEQVFEAYNKLNQDVVQLKTDVQIERAGPQVRPFQTRISDYRVAESKEDLLQIFFRQTPNQSWVFLKFIKTIQTYISVTHQNMPESWVEGLSYKVPEDEVDFNQKILVGNFPESFLDYLKDRWEVANLKFLPLILKNEIEGVLLSTQDIDAAVAEDFSLMSLVYNLLSIEAQPQFVDVEDPLTGFYNQLFYKRILDKEIDRSKRSFAPLSVIKIAVDTFKELEVSQGKHFCDEIIKKLADVIKTTSRLPDYACRTSENEFSIVLTNCDRKGAALRSERLRQKLKLESFTQVGVTITISQGISEYPSLTTSAEGLNESARKALDFISTKGGDKICIYKAPQDHKPDFQVNT